MVTDSQIAHYIAMFMIFVMAISFSIGCYKRDGIKPFTDKFELGYIEDTLPMSPSYVQVVDEYDELKDLERQVKIAKLKKQADKMKRSDKFKNTIRAREDMTDEQKMKVMDYVTNNIRTENEVELSKGGAVEFRNGGKVSLGKFKGNF